MVSFRFLSHFLSCLFSKTVSRLCWWWLLLDFRLLYKRIASIGFGWDDWLWLISLFLRVRERLVGSSSDFCDILGSFRFLHLTVMCSFMGCLLECTMIWFWLLCKKTHNSGLHRTKSEASLYQFPLISIDSSITVAANGIVKCVYVFGCSFHLGVVWF